LRSQSFACGIREDGKTYCTITDDRDEAPLKRLHVEVGTEIEIPNHKLTWRDGNPSGHSVVFLSRGGHVFCFVLIVLAYACLPLFGLWCAGGAISDRRDRNSARRRRP
jgi:hypothetical protein